jgi:hypothetical protein
MTDPAVWLWIRGGATLLPFVTNGRIMQAGDNRLALIPPNSFPAFCAQF